MSTQDEFDATWEASAEELAALQELQAQLAAQREQTAGEQAAAAADLQLLTDQRLQVQGQTRGLEGDVGSFRREQDLAADAARTARVDLAAAQGGGDFYSPDVGQQVAPDGTVTYDFDAHLHARGLDLDAGTSNSPPADRRIRWLRQSDGAVIAELLGWEVTNSQRVTNLTAHGNTVLVGSSLLGVVNDDAPTQQASIEARLGGGGLDRAQVTVRGQQATILDGNGYSDFLRRLVPGATRINYGSLTYTFPGGIAGSPWLTVAHGLGTIPLVQLVSCSGGGDGSSGYSCNSYYFKDATNLSITVGAVGFVPAANTTVNISWVAIG
jgi:hypothetical protein